MVELQIGIDSLPDVGLGPLIPTRRQGEQMLPLLSLRRDGGTQLRQTMSAEATQDYAAALERGELFPAAVVFDDGEFYWLSDGFHRYDAHDIQGLSEMLCEIRRGSRKDAILYAAKANRKHGIRETPADREKIVLTLVNEFPEALQADVARMAEMLPGTVSKILKRLNIDFRNSPAGRPRKDAAEPAPTPIEVALASVSEEQREAIEALLTAPLVPEDRAIEAAQNVAAMAEPERERVAELAASADPVDQSAAVAMMRGIVHVDPAWPLVNVALDDLRKGLRIHRGKPFEGAFRICIQHVEGLLESIESEDRRKTDVAT